MTRRRRLVYALSLFVLSLVIALWVFLASSWGLSLALRLASTVLPGKLAVAEHQGSLLGPIQLHDLQYQNQRVKISLQQAKLAWRILPLLYGKLELSKLALKDLDVELQSTGTEARKSAARLVLPLSFDVSDVDVHGLLVRTAAANKPMRFDELRFSAHGAGQHLQLRQFELSGYGARMRAEGELDLTAQLPLNLKLDLDYQAANGKSYASKGTLQGDMQSLTLRQTLSAGTPASLTATATDLGRKLHWNARLEVARLNPHAILVSAPELQVSGTLEANGDLRRLSADSKLEISSKALGAARLHLRGQSDIAFTEYSFTANGNARAVAAPPLSLNLLGKGNRQGLSMDKLELTLLRGTVNGQARIRWQPKLSLSSDLHFSQLQTARLFKNWPGEISGHLRLEHKPAASLLPIAFELQGVKGKLRKQALQAHIRGSWAKQQLILDQLLLKLGESKLQAQGRLAQRWDLGFQLESAQLEQLWPEAQGKLELSGRLQGSRAAPRLQMQAQATRIGYARMRIKSLQLNMDMGLGRQDPASLNLQAEELRYRGNQWQRVSLLSSGSSLSQRIELQASNDKSRLQLLLQGAYKAWQWHGTLNNLVIETPSHGVWQSQAPASIELARHHYRLSKLCVAQDMVYVCAQLRLNRQNHQAQLDAHELPVALLNPWLPQQLKLDGVVNVEGTLQATTAGELQAHLNVQSPDNSIRLNFPESKDQITLGPLSLKAQLDRKGLQAQLAIPLSKGGGLQAQFALPHWKPQLGLARNQALSASLNMDGVPAQTVTRLFPELAQANGTLQVSLKVDGRLGAPQMSGEARWRDGSVAVPVLGLNVHDVKAELKTARPNTLIYDVSARSGRGELQLNGQTRLLPERGWPTTIRLHSQDLEVSNIPQAYVVVNSEVKMEVAGETVHIDGDITIPQARLKPQTLPEGAISASPDVIVIHRRHTFSQQARWQVTTRLRVTLGDKVDFNGFGIRGKLRGNLLLTDAPGKLVMGQGELNIAEGMYRMRGRDLTIRRGRLIFSNTFIDDPALDVEAVRVIENVTAGVRIKGTLKKPLLTVFSEPAMPESEVLAYLILGHSLEQSTQAEGQSINRTASALGFIAGDYLEKGIGGPLGLDELRVDVNQATQNTSLVVGKYLSPKLYLRYYNGIAQSSRMVQLQYQLSRRVTIQTESGYQGTQSTTGGDIFFTIEY